MNNDALITVLHNLGFIKFHDDPSMATFSASEKHPNSPRNSRPGIKCSLTLTKYPWAPIWLFSGINMFKRPGHTGTALTVCSSQMKMK